MNEDKRTDPQPTAEAAPSENQLVEFDSVSGGTKGYIGGRSFDGFAGWKP